MERQQHRLMVPAIALLAVTLNVSFFTGLQGKFKTDTAASLGALLAFLVVTIIGMIFKPHLGD